MSARVAADTPAAPGEFPLALTAAALVAGVALLLNGGSAPALLLVALFLLAAHSSLVTSGTLRLADWAWLSWSLRGVAFLLVLATDNSRSATGIDWLLPAIPMRWLGQLCLVELALQRWRRTHSLGPRQVGAVLLASLAMMAGANTLEPEPFRVLGPLYVVLCALALPRMLPGALPAIHRAMPWRAWTLVGGTLALALLLGGTLTHLFGTHLRGLDSLALQFLAGHLGSRVSGFALHPSLGGSFDLQRSPQRVMRLLLEEDVARRGLASPHLRGVVYDRYRGRRWWPSLGDRRFLRAEAADLAGEYRAGARVTVERLAPHYGLLFVPLHAAGVIGPAEAATEWSDDGHMVLRAPAPTAAVDEYAWIEPPPGNSLRPLQGPVARGPRGSGRPAPWADEGTLLRCLEIPGDLHPRVRDLAAGLAPPNAAPAEKIRAVVAYLGAHHRYSLRVRPGQGEPLSDFLLNRRAAHCQYFAAAAVILLRLQDVPARYVQGYYAHEVNRSGVMVVRGRDAHAWAEAFVDGLGWVTVEATPAGGRPDELGAHVPPWLFAWEAMQDMATATGDWLSERRGAITAMGAGLLAVLLAGAAGWSLWTRGRAAAPAARHGDPAWNALAGRYDALLERAGIPCPPHLPWSEWLSAAEHRGELPPHLATPLRDFAAAYTRARFGAAPSAAPEQRSALQVRLAELEALAGARPLPPPRNHS